MTNSYHIPDNSDNKPWARVRVRQQVLTSGPVQKAFFVGLILGGAYFRRGLLLVGTLCFKMG